MTFVKRLVLSASLTTAFAPSAFAVTNEVATIGGVLNLGSVGSHNFTPDGGPFQDFLRFQLGADASGIQATQVSIQLGSFLNIAGLTGRLFADFYTQGNFPAPPPTQLGPTVSGNNVAFNIGPLAPGKYTFVYEGNATGSSGGSYLAAVAAVPEAHEWAMMLSGLGMVAFVVSRRRKAAASAAA